MSPGILRHGVLFARLEPPDPHIQCREALRSGLDDEAWCEQGWLSPGRSGRMGGDAHFSPAFMVSYLAYMSRQRDAAVFLATLPILGHDGTRWNIQEASPAAGHIFATTRTFAVDGPLNRRLLITGKGLAGYITTIDNRHLAFALFVNGVSVSTDPDATTAIVGHALGEIAAAAYDAR